MERPADDLFHDFMTPAQATDAMAFLRLRPNRACQQGRDISAFGQSK
ncbi:MAG: hypothetical protein OJF48_003493 [Afipia sp.]|nr:MAG: hypothetical protein OJF48_003493 [Afipia sp.]